MREPLNPIASVKVFHLLRSLHVSTAVFEKLSLPIRFQTHVLYPLQTLLESDQPNTRGYMKYFSIPRIISYDVEISVCKWHARTLSEYTNIIIIITITIISIFVCPQ